jgi:hypothetical protein
MSCAVQRSHGDRANDAAACTRRTRAFRPFRATARAVAATAPLGLDLGMPRHSAPLALMLGREFLPMSEDFPCKRELRRSDATTARARPARIFPADTRGNFFFADYSKFFLRRAVLDDAGRVMKIADVVGNVGEPVDMQFGRDGALYLLSHHSRGFMRVRAKDAPLGTLRAPNAVPQKPPLRIAGAGEGDGLLPGARVTLTVAAPNAAWSVTAFTGRRGRSLVRADGPRVEFVMPNDLGDDGFVEVIAAAVESARLHLYAPHSDGYIRSWWLLGSTPWFDLNMDALGGESGFVLNPDGSIMCDVQIHTTP